MVYHQFLQLNLVKIRIIKGGHGINVRIGKSVQFLLAKQKIRSIINYLDLFWFFGSCVFIILLQIRITFTNYYLLVTC